MQHLTVSTESLLDNACRLSDKVEKSATDNLLRGGTDKIILLATVRQLTGIIKQIKENYKSGYSSR